MSLFFLFNNLHFSLEIIGALTFLIVAWLSFDSFLLRRDFTTGSRFIGFVLLAVWQVIHAFALSSDLLFFVGYGAYIGGVVFVLWNLALEAPVERPEFKAIVILPGAGALLFPFSIIVTGGLVLIALFSLNQYKKELKKTLFPFWIGFIFLASGSIASIFYVSDSFSALWVIGHIFELAGFMALGVWVWSYLQLRIREEMLLIFVSLTLFMAIVVSLTFSSILITKIESETRANLTTNVRVLNLVITRLEQEALAKAKLLAVNDSLKNALTENNFVELEIIINSLVKKENLGFLTVLDKDGGVVFRAHALTQKGENLLGEKLVAVAYDGTPLVTIGTSAGEQFSIRAAAPIQLQEDIVGAVVLGFLLDSVLADSIKKITGLEMSIFENETQVATTIFNVDGHTRNIGIKNIDSRVLQAVLEEGNALTLRTTVLSRPFLASFLPLRDADNNIVGMISASKPQAEILETAQATNRLTLVIVMIIMIILIMPIYFITRRLSKEIV